jgi:hypothetical protein
MQQDSTRRRASGRVVSWLARIGRWLEPEENPAGVIYGIVVTGALLAAESTRQENLVEAVGATSVTLVLYWLAHAYSKALGDRLESGHAWSAIQLLRIVGHEAALLKGAALPLVVLVVAALAGTGTPDAVLAALVATGLLLVVLELIAGRRARLTGLELAVQVVVTASLGVGVVLLKWVVH